MAEETDTADTNGFNEQQVKGIVGRIEQHLADLLSERGAYMNRCRGIREGITAAYDDAKAHGIPKKELKALIRTRELERKIEQTRDDLENDERETFEQLQEALGDFGNTPLGQAAVDSKRRGDTLDSLHS
jgi:uncharacterized protein (UPF0335 family)